MHFITSSVTIGWMNLLCDNLKSTYGWMDFFFIFALWSWHKSNWILVSSERLRCYFAMLFFFFRCGNISALICCMLFWQLYAPLLKVERCNFPWARCFLEQYSHGAIEQWSKWSVYTSNRISPSPNRKSDQKNEERVHWHSKENFTKPLPWNCVPSFNGGRSMFWGIGWWRTWRYITLLFYATFSLFSDSTLF